MKKVFVFTNSLEYLYKLTLNLEGKGYNVDATQSPSEALRLLESGAYDSFIYIGEKGYNGSDGYELARIATGLRLNTRVILVSHNGCDTELRKFPCLKAPIRMNKLLKMMKSDPLEAFRASD